MWMNKFGTGGHASGDVAGAIDFDGANDYLSRSTDLVGNVDGKTFTFSAWVWRGDTALDPFLASGASSANARVWFATVNGGIVIYLRNSSDTNLLVANVDPASPGSKDLNTFVHVLISVDISNTSLRSAYINDAPASVTWTTYTNGIIDFTLPNWYVGGCVGDVDGTTTNKRFSGRLSNLYLDYTYRDLSVEANRRLFITADRKPAPKATLAALNPILYLPMTDPTQPGLNLGTGGDFALNGVVARSGRGPNQFNTAYSDLDGSADYLSRSNVSALAKTFTFLACFNLDTLGVQPTLIAQEISSANAEGHFVYVTVTGSVVINVRNGSNTLIVAFTSSTNSIVAGRNYVLCFSYDTSSAANRHVYLNGLPLSGTWTTYTIDGIAFSYDTYVGVNNNSGEAKGNYLDGKLGSVFLSPQYIDLSQPANLAKFVTGTGIDCKPVDLGASGELPFGTPPLIYLPMYGNNAGKNYGTGGDFTVNSGPFAGARGPNEYWGNKADFDGSTGYLARTSALTGVSDGKTFSCSFWFNPDSRDTSLQIFRIGELSAPYKLWIYKTSANTIQVFAYSTTGSELLSVGFGNYITGTSVFIQMSFDLSDTNKRHVYVNGNTASPTFTTYVNGYVNFAYPASYFGRTSSGYLDGKLSEFYFTTEYIDFSQEANRLKFRDAFGNPVDLMPQIEAGEIPNPAIYMRFDPANFGKNSGTGGDFTVNGAITDGGQL